jgi:hypothetical protein
MVETPKDKSGRESERLVQIEFIEHAIPMNLCIIGYHSDGQWKSKSGHNFGDTIELISWQNLPK